MLGTNSSGFGSFAVVLNFPTAYLSKKMQHLRLAQALHRAPRSMTVTTISPTSRVAVSHSPSPASHAQTASFHIDHPQQIHERRDEHKPNVQAQEDDDHYVLTLWTDKAHHQAMTALRRQWFPKKLLKVNAHVTLFHALPGTKLQQVKDDVAGVAGHTSPFDVVASGKGAYPMGKGVGVNISKPAQAKASQIRAELRDRWAPFLSEQDRRAKWKGQYTILNKENDKERVGRCMDEVRRDFTESRGEVEGLILWRYDRGWWRQVESFPFRNGQS
ncbi:uncharacterized protein F5Z01DRAFT_655739 [Emericellopsis atlantica]|uniref:Uncharacterized protein n=1 Tax=Emericellopsis atlantica TaxID=2614577 RepID=A0A9P8CNZ6_9HYPO|nr:uncharacterized protein F5Z01DRAFT_655739 [Emericellopsis atlantica]KAG9254023.1 hypothetical protein F5Z01DRAFT_655739 [Emericellopsis atlantica]